jgi:hypothetical protein
MNERNPFTRNYLNEGIRQTAARKAISKSDVAARDRHLSDKRQFDSRELKAKSLCFS